MTGVYTPEQVRLALEGKRIVYVGVKADDRVGATIDRLELENGTVVEFEGGHDDVWVDFIYEQVLDPDDGEQHRPVLPRGVRR